MLQFAFDLAVRGVFNMNYVSRFPRYRVYCDAIKVGNFVSDLLSSVGPPENVQLLIGKHVDLKLPDQTTLKG